MKTAQLTATILVCVFVAIGAVAKVSEYVPVGPPETENFEKGLCELLPGYVGGIYPKSTHIATGVSGENLPTKYTKKIEKWLKVVLNSKLEPEQLKKAEWMGIRKLRWDLNYIITRFSSNTERGSIYENAIVEVQAIEQGISLTVISNSLFPQDANGMSDSQILTSATKILNIPENKRNKISIEKDFRTIAGINVCYGKIRCEWHERQGSDEGREWWSYIPFWYVKGKIYVYISTIEKGERPSARAKSTWEF